MENSKKIFFLGPAYPYRGGIADSSERLASELQSMGHEVKMYTYTMQYPSLIFPGKSQFTDKEKPELEISRSYSSINPLSWSRLSKKILQEKPDLVIDRFWLPYLGMSSGSIMKRLNKNQIKTVSIVDNLIPHQNMIGDNYLIKKYMSSHDHHVVMSSSVQKEIEERFSKKSILHIPHPVYDIYGSNISKQEACKALDLDADKKYMLFFGYIKPYKGLDLLLKSLDLEYLQKNNLTLIIAGEVYGDASVYFDLINERGLEDHIIFHKKFISDHMVRNYFCASDLIVQTYHSATQSGISQLALQFEKSVLVTDVGGLSEMVQHNSTGYVVEKDEQSIMHAIKDFFQNNRAESFRVHIQKLKKENAWRAFAEKLLAFSFAE